MARRIEIAVAFAAIATVSVLSAQAPSERQIAQERKQAESEVPKLVEVLQLEPGMTAADVGSGGGAMTVVLGKWIGSGHVFATDITEHALRETREYAKREGLANVTVVEGAAASTNLPDACCDAIFMRDVYHHITQPDAFNKSLMAALKPGGRVAVIDFLARPGSQLFPGVNPNRGGHGVPPAIVVSELSAAGLRHTRTVDSWPDDKARLFLVLFRKP